ncbi:hypothetical protein LTR85_000401 [Meristemomyces frigidus]|nr:hypothetical protein LTR85_000401 [Meristemomyces frigidus]
MVKRPVTKSTQDMAVTANYISPSSSTPAKKRKASEEPEHPAPKSKKNARTYASNSGSLHQPDSGLEDEAVTARKLPGSRKPTQSSNSARARNAVRANESVGAKAVGVMGTATEIERVGAAQNIGAVETPAELKKGTKSQSAEAGAPRRLREDQEEAVKARAHATAGTEGTNTPLTTAKAQKVAVRSRKPATKTTKTTRGAKMNAPTKRNAVADDCRPMPGDRVHAKNPENGHYHGAVIKAVHDEGEKLTYDINFDRTDFILSGFTADRIGEPCQLPAQTDGDGGYEFGLNDMVLAQNINGRQDYLPARVLEKDAKGCRVVFQHRPGKSVVVQLHQTTKMYQDGPTRLAKGKVAVWPTSRAQTEWAKIQANTNLPKPAKKVPESELGLERFAAPHNRGRAEGGGKKTVEGGGKASVVRGGKEGEEGVGGWTNITVASELKRGYLKNAIIYAQLHEKGLQKPADINGELNANSDNANDIATCKAHQGERTINIFKDSIDHIYWQNIKANDVVYISFVAKDQRSTLFAISASTAKARKAALNVGRAVVKKWSG